jgi:hypothetical protein
MKHRFRRFPVRVVDLENLVGEVAFYKTIFPLNKLEDMHLGHSSLPHRTYNSPGTVLNEIVLRQQRILDENWRASLSFDFASSDPSTFRERDIVFRCRRGG